MCECVFNVIVTRIFMEGFMSTKQIHVSPVQDQTAVCQFTSPIVGCRELRSRKYISDGQCTSVNPIKELVCAGECLPSHLLPNWIGSRGYTGRYWSRRDAQEWRCVIDRTRTQRIRLQCEDGSSRAYKITVVTSCKCKRYTRQQNDSDHKQTPEYAHSLSLRE
uniref:Sclerostin domain containing 1b n=1 Tax=Acanthochromis polyacanthus TaxID=80966 RepID=A0A3Q1G824_9TELE